jgi:hypothetical protein
MPLARYALYSQGIDLLLSPTYDEGETCLCSVRHIAKEGRIFVASASETRKSKRHRRTRTRSVAVDHAASEARDLETALTCR